jgi:hypothetical protein
MQFKFTFYDLNSNYQVHVRRNIKLCLCLTDHHILEVMGSRSIFHTFLISVFGKISGQVYALASLPLGKGPLDRRVGGFQSQCLKRKIPAPARQPYRHLWADCLEKKWEPRRLTTLWAFTVRYRDNFTFFYLPGTEG